MKKATLYIAGPMSGYPQFNFPAFYAAARVLKAQGFEVINPADLDPPEVQDAAWNSKDGHKEDGKVADHTWGSLPARDVQAIADGCDGVVLLPGWQQSKGARLECFTAQICQIARYELVGTRLVPCNNFYQLVNHHV